MNIYILTFLISFISSVFLLVIFIPVFRKIKVSQSVRLEGPKEHLKKNGTPTMGGVFIIICAIITFIIISLNKGISDKKIVLLLFPTLVYALIGFIDDELIVIKRKNDGIKPKIKFLLQVVFAFIYYIIYLYYGNYKDTSINFFGIKIELYIFYGLLVIFMLVASSNAVNLTDGLDGLASGLVIIALIVCFFLSYQKDFAINIYIVSLIGSVLGFLCYNFHPAKLFMGDVGSLSLGVTVANILILLKMEVLLVFVGCVFIIETLSVIIQVAYFKKTNGMRLFLMTPIHHHFELKGLNEYQIDLLFWIIAIIMGTLGLYFGYRFY